MKKKEQLFTEKHATAFPYSTSFPCTPGTQWIPFNPAWTQLSPAFTSMHVEKMDSDIVRMQIEATKDIASKIHSESMRGYELQEKNTDYQHELELKYEAKDNGILIYLGILVLAILITGIVIILQGSKTEGVGIVSSVLGLLLGFLGGYGVASRGN